MNHPDAQSNLSVGLWKNHLVGWLFTSYGSATVPYQQVASDYFGWTSAKTAQAKIAEVRKAGLVISDLEMGSKRHIVHISDLADFLLAKRTVSISD
ncbi:pyocin activator PrtN family protein [Bowmanella sp. Y26]|uniref:pyocin activator PrtN family protein n=1 Tax=Bowmanella yangjiangensis TaxID=2811230 RepID=UPI001BDCDBEF|nr:pyocin activator PrtN family protein [Bowmanella yangjiangensis]MBT1066160.1 pyocin activator PrtN family protein [Bowmanella yangjiangensis]